MFRRLNSLPSPQLVQQMLESFILKISFRNDVEYLFLNSASAHWPQANAMRWKIPFGQNNVDSIGFDVAFGR